MRAFWPIVVAFSLVAATASAAPRDARGRALELFERSARAYREGRFQDAIDLLVEAHRVKAEPVLLYNLGRAYEAVGRPTDAADAYAEYLREDPRAPDRGAIEGRIATLRSQADQLEKAKIPPAEERPLPAEERPLPVETPPPRAEAPAPVVVPWVLLGVGAVGIGTGVTLAVAAEGRHDDATREPLQAPAQDKQEEAESLATGATIALVAGGALAGVGLAWLSVRALAPARNVSLLASPWAFTLKGTF